MMSTELTSNLDSSAPEFHPGVESMRDRCVSTLKTMIKPLFTPGNRDISQQLIQVRKVTELKDINASTIVGEIIAEMSTSVPERVAVGFRFFKQLRDSLPDKHGPEVEVGLTGCLHELTKRVIQASLIRNHRASENITVSSSATWLPIATTTTATTGHCEQAGDVPSFENAELDRFFGLINFFNLTIKRLNLPDSPDECICVPPHLPCIDLCIILENVARVQLLSDRSVTTPITNGSSTSDTLPDAAFQKDWNGLFYLLLDTFSQCLPFISYLLQAVGSGIVLGAWHYLGSTEERQSLSTGSPPTLDVASGDMCAELSDRLNRSLVYLRQLLVNNSLPSPTIRSLTMDVLLAACELSAQTRMCMENYGNWNEAGDYRDPSYYSDQLATGDQPDSDVDLCFQQFLEETEKKLALS